MWKAPQVTSGAVKRPHAPMALGGPAEQSMRLMAAPTWWTASIWIPRVWQMAREPARLITCRIPTNRNSLQSKTNTGRVVNQTLVAANCLCAESREPRTASIPPNEHFQGRLQNGLASLGFAHLLTPSVLQSAPFFPVSILVNTIRR